ncbi:hypothetical protein RFI_26600 [Reticulomyxa filosa]|uniref:Uncharacterized protein n=1 Tax=Reticulomyxa filosa TaxID=46433 RepID=X6MBD4_RETFI|nr:hypothetical protein RFI_26600 [Reticulomyxa filosa]|eukprot:ETO10777.1 hypothetical protein RFI_26600 [Reticulomyxa filosa]
MHYSSIVNKETSLVARSDIDKAYLLAKTFAEPPQPPKDVDEKHYEMIEDDTRFKVAISKPLELNNDFIVSDIHQSNITKEEGPDNIHNQMLKNVSARIALLSSVGKLIERIITRRLMWWLNDKQLLHQTQAGFQSWHNTD